VKFIDIDIDEIYSVKPKRITAKISRQKLSCIEPIFIATVVKRIEENDHITAAPHADISPIKCMFSFNFHFYILILFFIKCKIKKT
jgi:hypothetical protein